MLRVTYRSFKGNYSLPPRTQRPASEEETARLSAQRNTSQIDVFCQEYLLRMYASKIMLHNDEGELKNARGQANKRVLAALCDCMGEQKCACFRADIRGVAGKGQVDNNTVTLALRRLENAGYILNHPACPSEGQEWDRYSLVMDKFPQTETDAQSMRDVTDLESIATGNLFNLTTECLPVPDNETDEEKDARMAADRRSNPFHARNLGPFPTALYALMCVHQGLTKTQIARKLGCSVTAVTNNLKILMAHNMVQQGDERDWFTCSARIRSDDDTGMIVHQCSRDRRDRKVQREIDCAKHVAQVKDEHPDDWETVLALEAEVEEEGRRLRNEKARARKSRKHQAQNEAALRRRVADERDADFWPTPLTGDGAAVYGFVDVP